MLLIQRFSALKYSCANTSGFRFRRKCAIHLRERAGERRSRCER